MTRNQHGAAGAAGEEQRGAPVPGARPAAGRADVGFGAQPLAVHFFGTRGSVPTPESANAATGGNTSCVGISGSGGPVVLLDGGTGIRAAGRALGRFVPGTEYEIFLTHYHWDHVQGMPFFAPLHEPEARVRVHAPCQPGSSVADILRGLLAPLYFPVPHDGFAARITLHELALEPWRAGQLRVDSLRVQHPSNTHGLRIRGRGRTVVYVPDNELGTDAATRAALARFAHGADLLIHDAMLTDAEYTTRAGWGHSTFRQAVRLAEDAAVRRLRLFHHAPDRTDQELARILGCLREELARRGSALDVDVAREGERVEL